MNEKLQQTPQSPESVNYKIDKLLARVRDRIDVLDFHEKMGLFTNRIKENNPNYQQYRCYHQLIGSTPREGYDMIEGDFGGEYSIVAFLEGLLKETSN